MGAARLLVANQLRLIRRLLEALPVVLHLVVTLAHHMLVHRLQIVHVGLVDGRHDTAAVVDLACRLRQLGGMLRLLGSLRLDVLLVANDSLDGRPVDIVFGRATGGLVLGRLPHVLRFIQVVGQVFDLALVHRDLRDILR